MVLLQAVVFMLFVLLLSPACMYVYIGGGAGQYVFLCTRICIDIYFNTMAVVYVCVYCIVLI